MTKTRNELVGKDDLKEYKGYGKRFGNGAHIILPKTWVDKRLEVRIIEE